MGPLSGKRIIELAGIGPGPFCGMLLADMGAEVIRVERPGPLNTKDVLIRGRKSIALDLKSDAGREIVLKLCEQSDALFEGFRPGVTERLGVGPEQCMARNEKLVYGRMTGWGQDGPLAQAAGHDINYVALNGALHAVGESGGKPIPPLNLVGDFGGGGMFLAFGMVCAMLEAQQSGKGQVVDAAMVDGGATLMAAFFGLHAAGVHTTNRGTNLLDGGAHFYSTYETLDGKYISIGSIEPQFYALLVEKAGLDAERFSDHRNTEKWPALKEELTAVFKTKTRDEWCEIMEGTDICFAPVLALDEAKDHPHNKARNAYKVIGGVLQPAPAPRFSRTEPEIQSPAKAPGEDTETILESFGYGQSDIDELVRSGAVALSS